MSDFGEMKDVLARKHGSCVWCYGPIPKGETHKHYKGMFDGQWQNWKMHDECYAAYVASSDYGNEGFTPGEGEMPERVKALIQVKP
jgi:hypothetical protein